MIRVAVVLACLALAGCSSSPSAPSVTTTATVMYSVTGPMLADITYTNESGGVSQVTKVALPWTLTFSASKGQLLSLDAFNASIPEVAGHLVVTIFVNGKPFKQAFSDGGFLTGASISGTF